MERFTTLTSRTVVLSAANIDTDQIIPARFLTTTTRAGLGKRLFADWRYDEHGVPRAELALTDHGFRAVISTEFADIFANNALKNGLLPVIVEEATAAWLIAHPGAALTIDVARRTLALPDGSTVSFPLEAFARHRLLEGVDELGFLLARAGEIDAFERRA